MHIPEFFAYKVRGKLGIGIYLTIYSNGSGMNAKLLQFVMQAVGKIADSSFADSKRRQQRYGMERLPATGNQYCSFLFFLHRWNNVLNGNQSPCNIGAKILNTCFRIELCGSCFAIDG